MNDRSLIIHILRNAIDVENLRAFANIYANQNNPWLGSGVKINIDSRYLGLFSNMIGKLEYFIKKSPIL